MAVAPLQKPRWAGGPKICARANLPAFESAESMRAFHKSNGPSCKVLLEWECTGCGHWHNYTLAPDPAGGSSGTGRSSKSEMDFTLKEMTAMGVPETQGRALIEARRKKEAAEKAAREAARKEGGQ